MALIQRFLKDEGGQTSLEYAMIGAFISILIIGGVTKIGTRINTLFFNQVANNLS